MKLKWSLLRWHVVLIQSPYNMGKRRRKGYVISSRIQHRLLETFLVTLCHNMQEICLLHSTCWPSLPYRPEEEEEYSFHLEVRVRLSYFCSQEFFAKENNHVDKVFVKANTLFATGSTNIIIYFRNILKIGGSQIYFSIKSRFHLVSITWNFFLCCRVRERQTCTQSRFF